jgi:hypothetical protein
MAHRKRTPAVLGKLKFPITFVSLGGIWRVVVYDAKTAVPYLMGHWRIAR